MKCRICASLKTKVIKKIISPYTEQDYYLYKCESCNCRFFNHLEHNINYKEFYQKRSKTHEATKNPVFKKKKSWIDLKIELINSLGKEPKSILDVGCRTGDFLMHFDENISREGVELAKDSAKVAWDRGLTVHNDFIENITFNKKYDIVSCLAVLEHLIEPVKFLNSLNTLVENRGILLIMIPTFECLKEKILNKLNISWHMYEPPEHLNFFSKSWLDNFMTNMGFMLVKRKYTSGGIINPFPSSVLLKKIVGSIFYKIDHSVFNKLPIFDHMYSIYKKS